MKIKDITKKYGISRKALLVYENKELIHPHRDSSGYREYNEDDIKVISKIVFLRKLEFSLDEIAVLLSQNESDFMERKRNEYDKDIHFIEMKKSYLKYADKVIRDEYSSDEAIEAIGETLDLISQDTFEGIDDFEYHYEATFVLWVTSLVISIISMNTYLVVASLVMGIVALLICMKSVRRFFKKSSVKMTIGILLMVLGSVGMSIVIQREDTMVHEIYLMMSLFLTVCGLFCFDQFRNFINKHQNLISCLCFILGILMMILSFYYQTEGLLGLFVLQIAVLLIGFGIIMNSFLRKLVIYIFLDLI